MGIPAANTDAAGTTITAEKKFINAKPSRLLYADGWAFKLFI